MENSLPLLISVGRGDHGGKLEPSSADKHAIGNFLAPFIGIKVQVTFSKPTKPRSNRQNKYMWGVLYRDVATETGHTTEEIHVFCKDKFLPRQFVIIAGEERNVPKSTKDLTTAEMEQYLERVRAWAAQELRLGIPLPGE